MSNPMLAGSQEGSITAMIRRLRVGDRDQVASLWGRYFDRLVALASPIVRNGPQNARGTEEDAALSAINTIWEGLPLGKFDKVKDRDDLWCLLAIITKRKALQKIRQSKPGCSIENDMVAVAPMDEILRLTVSELIEALENPLWRQAALLRLEGYSTAEIARELGFCRETVFIWFRTIREIWREKAGGEWPLD